jgi:hypothetical protein
MILVDPDDLVGDEDAPRPPAPTSRQAVGGAIAAHTDLDLGRPAGKQNRPAAGLALLGAVIMAAGGVLPWATRSFAVGGSTELGWRDASGELSSGLYVVLLAVTVVTVAVRCLAGSYSREWRLALAALGVGAVVLAAVEAVRIVQAMEQIDLLTRGNAGLSFGPGLAVVAIGGLVVLAGAGAYRVGSPH